MRYIFSVVLSLLVIILFACPAPAFDIEPQLRLGTIHLDEHGVREGNKFTHGISVEFSGGDKVFWSLRPEIWQVAEPMDEDKEIPDKGYSLRSQLGYRLYKTKDFELTPVIGLDIGRIEREGQNSKWVGDKTWSYSSWTYLTYVWPTLGVNLTYKFLYGKLNLPFPWYWEGDTTCHSSGRFEYQYDPHLDLEAGVKFGDLTVGAFYRKLSFDQLENNVYLMGGLIGYKF